MKRSFYLAGFLLALNCSPGRVLAQDAQVAAAERQEAEDRHKRMTARIEDLELTLQSYQKSLQRVQEELRTLRDEVARANNNQSSQESLRSLEKAIKEVDKKRMEDNERVLAELNKALTRIEKSLSGKPPPTGRTAPSTPSPPSGSEKGYEYAIRDKDTLSLIVKTLRDQGIKVTQKQVMDANPNVNWNNLQIGRKIFIPAPAQP